MLVIWALIRFFLVAITITATIPVTRSLPVEGLRSFAKNIPHALMVARVRQPIRRPRGIEEFTERESNFSSGEDIKQIKRAYDTVEEVYITKVNGEVPDVYHLPPAHSEPNYPSQHNGPNLIAHPHNAYSPLGHGVQKHPNVHSGIANRPYQAKGGGKGLVYSIGRIAGKLAEKATRVAHVIGQTTGEVLEESAALLNNAGNALVEAVKGAPASHTVASGLHVTIPHYDHVKEHKFGAHVTLGMDSEVISRPHGYKKRPSYASVRPYFHILSRPSSTNHNQHSTDNFHKIPNGGVKGIHSSGSKLNFTPDGFLVTEHHSSPHLPEYEKNHGLKHPGLGHGGNHDYEVAEHSENPGHPISYEIHEPPGHHYHIKDKAKPVFHHQDYLENGQHHRPRLPGADYGYDEHETHRHPKPHDDSTEETRGVSHEKLHNIQDVFNSYYDVDLKPEITEGEFFKDELPQFSYFPEYMANYDVSFDHDGASEYNYDANYDLDDPLKDLYIHDAIGPVLDLAPRPGYHLGKDTYIYPEGHDVPSALGPLCEATRQKFHLYADRKDFQPGPLLYNSLCMPYHEIRRQKTVSRESNA